MNKDIKDYLHLYLGVNCRFKGQELKGKINQENLWKLFSVTQMDYGLQGNLFALGCVKTIKAEDIYPILRPLSDMTQVEAQTIFSRYFEKDWTEDWSGDTGSAYFNPKKVIPTIESAMRIINGQDYESGDFMKVISLVPYLLSKGFDLFNLIPEGLAIDKTKITDHGKQ